MSYSFASPDRPTSHQITQTKELFGKGKNSLPDGTYYFVCGFGKTDNGDAWSWNMEHITDNTPVIYESCSMWVNEINEKGGYLNWIYSGDDDPMVDLGRTLKPNEQSLTKLIKAYGPQTKFATKSPDVRFLLPVVQVGKIKKEYDISKPQPMVLIVKANMMKQILDAANASAIADLPNAQTYGKVLEIKKNMTEKMADMYKFSLLAKDLSEDIPKFNDSVSKLHDDAMASVQRVFDTGNLGAYGADNVRKYIVQQTNMSYEAFVDKYNSLPDVGELTQVGEITF
jgi:hypothetical protein